MTSTIDISDKELSPYWSDQVPGTQKLNEIVQIEYYLRSQRGKQGDNFIDIWAFNTFAEVTKKNPYYWVTFPSSYSIHLQRLLFRLEVLKYVALAPKGKSDLMDVKRYLAHLDRTIDAMFDDAKDVHEKNQMNKDWRSAIFDRYLVVEFHCQRHKPHDIKSAIKGHPRLFDLTVDDLSEYID